VDGPGYIPPAKLAVINRAALDACDGNDGLVDGLIQDPPSCKFDPVSIQCHGPDAPSCLTPGQVDTVRKVYAGAKFNDGKPIYSGFERGSELTWNLMLEKQPFWVNLAYFKGMVFEDRDWDFRSFDVDRDTRFAEMKTGAAVDAADPDLRSFKQAGGKLILVSSWNSTGLPPRALSEYYRSVEQAMGGAEQTRDFARLFTVPGSAGCPGFRNPQEFDAFAALQQWVEHGKAPDKIIYAQRHAPQENVYRTRPVCAYPEQARYTGSGDPNDAANFSCGRPAGQ
jgi:feruloyl esterase